MDWPSKDDREDLAFGIVYLIEQCWIEPTDVPCAPDGTADALMHMSEGRKGVLEVSTLADTGEYGLPMILHSKYSGKVPNPGKWPWRISVPKVTVLDRAIAIAPKVIAHCEAHGVSQVRNLPLAVIAADPDLQWAIEDDGPFIHGFPPGAPGDDADTTWIDFSMQSSGTFTRDPADFMDGLNEAVATKLVQGKFAKLSRTTGDERHLFLYVRGSGMSVSAHVGLTEGRVPPADPSVSPDLTALWLHTGFNGDTVTVWRRGGGWSVRGYRLFPTGSPFGELFRKNGETFWSKPYGPSQT